MMHEVDLSADPFDDNLGEELKARAPRNLTSRTTLSLAGVVLIVGGFVGGVLVQKNFGTTTGSTASAFPTAGLNFGAGGGQQGSGRGTAAPATTGTVKLVDGSTVYVTTADGQTLIVKTSTSTVVKLEQTGALKDLPVGATVSVQGTTATDGVITATSVTAQK